SSDFRLQPSDFNLQTSTFRLQPSDFDLLSSAGRRAVCDKPVARSARPRRRAPFRRRMQRIVRLLIVAGSLLGGPAAAFAQVDFSGEWAPRFHEDQPE